MDILRAVIEWELQFFDFGAEVYFSFVYPCCQAVLVYAAFLFHYLKFLSRTCAVIFEAITPPEDTEKALEKRVHYLQKSAEHLDEDSVELEKELEDLEQDCCRGESLLSKVMAERETLVTRLEYLELCFEKASKQN